MTSGYVRVNIDSRETFYQIVAKLTAMQTKRTNPDNIERITRVHEL